MLGRQNEIFWGDKWGVENSTAWFVAGKFNVLFSVDMDIDRFKIVAALPGGLNLFRQNSNCIKCENTIFCMPDKGDCIWCYDLLTKEFQKIEIINPNYLSAGIGDFWLCDEILWAVSGGLKQILEIDIKKKKVAGYYKIPTQEDENLAKCAKDGNYIYVTSASKGKIYIFNIEKKELKVQELSVIKNGLRTISVNGEKIWLSGYKKEIYMWNQTKKEVELLSDFPLNFGIYNLDGKEKTFLDCEAAEYDTFTFLESVDAGGYIWFIPFQTSQILYVNKDTNEINSFEIEGEQEDEDSIKNRELNCKYVLQYVYNDRYIGLYSIKNRVVYEIDVYTMKLSVRKITIDIENSMTISGSWILEESVDAERALYKQLIGTNGEKILGKEKIGMKIYNVLVKNTV